MLTGLSLYLIFSILLDKNLATSWALLPKFKPLLLNVKVWFCLSKLTENGFTVELGTFPLTNETSVELSTYSKFSGSVTL